MSWLSRNRTQGEADVDHEEHEGQHQEDDGEDHHQEGGGQEGPRQEVLEVALRRRPVLSSI